MEPRLCFLSAPDKVRSCVSPSPNSGSPQAYQVCPPTDASSFLALLLLILLLPVPLPVQL